MRRIYSFWQLLTRCLLWFHQSTIVAEKSGNVLPPIRYDDDPTDIYLA